MPRPIFADRIPEKFTAFVAEVSDELRDRPLRGAIDSQIRHLFECFDEGHWDGVRQHLSPDAKLIDSLDGPEDIYTYTDSIMTWFEAARYPNQRTAHQLLLVDRGRVTCYVTHFAPPDPNTKFNEQVFHQKREVYIIDLDEQYQIRRIELRGNTDSMVERNGSSEAVAEIVRQINSDAIQMTETYFQNSSRISQHI
ncbi:hypothetical protein LX32DRAFT_638753 [Colletotrichum zoysiae]|uniref:SnoaL-like domain-containing protein n=1 Tax=Colletotrichum zoysiae TaxID=1216348 RepID=A0AAD9M5L1_9PEZI|nr:hypothetical protein LX32DRAFT_638753 [Colletotrichum zoysiae]